MNDIKANKIGNWGGRTSQSASVYLTNGLCPTLTSAYGGNVRPYIIEVKDKKKELKVRVMGGVGIKKSNGGSQYYQQDRVYDIQTISPALNASGDNFVPKIIVRK